ncbi:hypothetical protein MtrunA17_Chr1g0164071 [Medicago truncatula]|uniref:Uncharacterized protein n=1 Tax=Medicago truncatula TaxID=3880 RepID=A0A396JUF3_MEDTR|nr:hypothetical protein MtrunA17_Chr1g0164071 [Medicago truncatula]
MNFTRFPFIKCQLINTESHSLSCQLRIKQKKLQHSSMAKT